MSCAMTQQQQPVVPVDTSTYYTSVHLHPISYSSRGGSFRCDACKSNYGGGGGAVQINLGPLSFSSGSSVATTRYRCTQGCDFDLCPSCFAKYKLYESGAVRDHPHTLRIVGSGNMWRCDGCRRQAPTIQRYRCTQGCDFDLCDNCFHQQYIGAAPAMMAVSSAPISMSVAVPQIQPMPMFQPVSVPVPVIQQVSVPVPVPVMQPTIVIDPFPHGHHHQQQQQHHHPQPFSVPVPVPQPFSVPVPVPVPQPFVAPVVQQHHHGGMHVDTKLGTTSRR